MPSETTFQSAGELLRHMPSLFRFLFVVGVIAGCVTAGLYVLAIHFEPEPVEVSKPIYDVKVRNP